MKKANYIIFDCETGGVDDKLNPITQIALLTIDCKTLKEIDRFEMYIKPYDDLKIEKKALEVTGLKMIDINKGEDKKEAVKIITKYLKASMPSYHPSNKPILVGHNVKFDIGFVSELFKREDKDFSELHNGNHIDTMTFSKMLDEPGALKLGDCCERAGVSLKNAHKAMNDVVATTDLLRVYINTFRGNEIAETTVGESDKKPRVTFQF